jgi:inner membrane protein
MIAGTHVAFASALYLGGAALFEYPPDLTGWALASVASLLPDIDLPTSKLGRVAFWLSTRLERDFGHRTITHSFLALAVVAMLAGPLWLVNPAWFWAIVGGYWSHLWIDMVNYRGADLLWPSPLRFVFPGNKNYRMATGSKAEMVLMTSMVVMCLLLYPVSGLGLRTGLQHLLGNFEMAHDSYRKHAGGHWHTLRLEGIDNLTLEQVTCDCPVVGTWRQGLVVLKDGELRAVGESQTSDNIFPTHAELVQGEPLRVISQRVNMRGRALQWLLDQIDKQHTYYLSGELRMGGRQDTPVEDIDQYKPARFMGRMLMLRYARARELGPYRNLVAAEGEIFVQFWLKPGDSAVELSVDGGGGAGLVPEVLRGYL